MVRRGQSVALNTRVSPALKAEIEALAIQEGQSGSGMVKRIIEAAMYWTRELGSWSAVMEAEISVPARQAKKLAANPAKRGSGEGKGQAK
jgi:hypothetical protein